MSDAAEIVHLKHGGTVAVFIGVQSGGGRGPDLPLYNLTRPVDIYPVGATVTAQTLNRLGYSAPWTPDEEREMVRDKAEHRAHAQAFRTRR